VLTEHPEIEFVQIALNPIDWDSELVQAGPCYEVIRKHGRKVVVMEAVKGGGLAKLPDEAEALLKALHPDWSIASWSVRFCLEKDDVIAVLSGMSTLEQVLDNTKTANEAAPLTDADKKTLAEAMRLYRESIKSERTVTAIQLAQKSGFRSYSTFAAAFKFFNGLTVTAWTKMPM
jgi:predicted aldo/keto reductase-like oxidoreductase